jgi:hypothetical protein
VAEVSVLLIASPWAARQSYRGDSPLNQLRVVGIER